ncbi:hypothetical protein RchiOBHm_Chr6g0255161 [Rosa chinensis]|uniref:Uncharacterized protein n=1 Tax=Rosa chinensis TaxID=74649 RepID=A0A2P6PLT2_ROSCH|nr:hypothetical protein RchiOBHm_Chr6g0255161 [Rosa chinensis]
MDLAIAGLVLISVSTALGDGGDVLYDGSGTLRFAVGEEWASPAISPGGWLTLDLVWLLPDRYFTELVWPSLHKEVMELWAKLVMSWEDRFAGDDRGLGSLEGGY